MANRVGKAAAAAARRWLATSRASVEGEKVYYSQSGCWMTVPGTAGLRALELGLHQQPDVSKVTPANAEALAAAGLSSVVLPRRLDPAGREVKEFAAAVTERGASAAAVTRGGGAGDDAPRYLDSLRNAGVSEVLVEFSLGDRGSLDDGGALQQAVTTAEAAAERGLAVRAVLRDAFLGAEDDGDENVRGPELEDAVLALADAGAGDAKGLVCGVISVSDCAGEATEEMVRDTVEACFGVDCRGESMMERLSLRLGARGTVETALALGVTRFEASCLPTPGSLLTADLIDAVEAAGIDHAIDRKALDLAAADISK